MLYSLQECDTIKPNTEELRQKYIDNPPEGMTSRDIRKMSDDELLDMDYFLHEELDDEFGEEGFIYFNPRTSVMVFLFIHLIWSV